MIPVCHCTYLLHEDQGEDQKRFLMLPCFFYFINLDFLQQSHTLRQPLLVVHDSKDSSASVCANLEVKKKSPLIGAGELKVKREAFIHESSEYNVLFSPHSLIGRTKFYWGAMSPFYREGTSPIPRHSVSVTISLLLDIGLGIH
jgi:hypothetical protein